MVKQTAKIDYYQNNNVYFVGKEKPLFIPPEYIKDAIKNFPSGKVVTYKTKDKQRGTLEGMAEPTANEMKSYQQDQKAAEAAGQKPSEFEPAGNLPRDPEAEKQRAAAALQRNLDEKRETEKPACFKAALCPKGCDGTKDPCQFKPKIPAAKPKESAAKKDPPAKTAPEGSPSSSAGEKPSIQTNPQEAMKIAQGHDMLESILNADPRVIDHIAEHDPDLWDAFREKMLGVMPDKKTPDLKLPSESDLVSMTLNYDSYWKAKTLADIVVRHDIRKQVEFKNWTECLNLAITFHKMDHPSHAELQKLFTSAVLFHRFIHDRLNNVPLLDEVTKDA